MRKITTAKARVAVVLAAMLVLLPGLVQPARAEVLANRWIPYGPQVFDEGLCGMGDLLLTGNIHVVARTEGEGKTALSIHVYATGEDLSSGATYIFLDDWTQQVTSEGEQVSYVESVPIVGEGPAPNLSFLIVFSPASDGYNPTQVTFLCH